ncbi:MAG: hypothetical protein BWZ06_01021 [Bacteroidetes bacterium ADurb.BinA261]|nr:MAG: hypothetical protein BWZ06_01021 [Bacteroidetes bacterium ADurb.BinA261]
MPFRIGILPFFIESVEFVGISGEFGIAIAQGSKLDAEIVVFVRNDEMFRIGRHLFQYFFPFFFLHIGNGSIEYFDVGYEKRAFDHSMFYVFG